MSGGRWKDCVCNSSLDEWAVEKNAVRYLVLYLEMEFGTQAGEQKGSKTLMHVEHVGAVVLFHCCIGD